LADSEGVKLMAGCLQLAVVLATLRHVLDQKEVDEAATVDAERPPGIAAQDLAREQMKGSPAGGRWPLPFMPDLPAH
jgi:hypothetical protein